MRVQIALLGPVEVVGADGEPIAVPGTRLRMLLARLALERGRPVSATTLIDDLWGEELPAGVEAALQTLVSRLRRALGGGQTVHLSAGGYQLAVRPADVDVHRFDDLATRGRSLLGADQPKEAASVLAAALDLWRDDALADVRDAPFTADIVTALDEQRTGVTIDRFDAELRLGRHAEVLTELTTAAKQHPLSERLAELRMRALWAAGRQADALKVYDEIRDRLADELGVDPAAGLSEVHLALLRGELERPVAAESAAAPGRLPAALTSFVGRERELATLAALMAESRLVTVVGPGGAGKTRLALEAGARDRAFQRGRLWFAALASVSQPDQLAGAVLTALGRLSAETDPQAADAVAGLVELLDVGDAVLVLDNCEHLIDAVAKLADALLGQLPQLRILATSREPLALTGEALCHLGPLELPGADPDVAEAASATAVQLFVDRARKVRADFDLDESTAGAVAEVCRRLDGMPLALELAAATLRAMTIEQVAERLVDRFRLLTSGSRAALPRQRSLHAVVQWSWELLTERERILARRLSVFPSGATLASVEAVCADDELPEPDVVYVVSSLVEKSFVYHDGDRYRMLETIRNYAATALAESGDDVNHTFVDHLLSLAEQHEPQLRTRDQLGALELFAAEHDNLGFALQTVLDAGDVDRGARFVRALFWYWQLKGMTTQVAQTVAEVLAFDGLPEPHAAALRALHATMGSVLSEHGERAGNGGADAVGRLPADALAFHPAIPMLAMAKAASADDRSALRDHAITSPDPWVRATAMWAYDLVRVEQGDLEVGREDRARALQDFEESGDRWGMALCLGRLSGDHDLRAEHAGAIASAERAVAISTELGSADLIWRCKGRLARSRMNDGDLEGAFRDLRAALGQAEAEGHRRAAANLWAYVSIGYRLAGDIAEADRALDRMEAVADRPPAIKALNRDASAGFRMANRLAQGDASAARTLLREAVAETYRYGFANGMASGAELLGWLLSLEGDPEGAAHALGMSQVIRGAFNQGDSELRRVVAALTDELGEDGYRAAYRSGATLHRDDALNLLADQADFLR